MFKEIVMALPNERTEMILRIANATCSTTVTVYRWLSGRVEVPPVKRQIIAEVMGRPMEELFPSIPAKKGGEE